MNIFNRLFCKHEYQFDKNIPGPQRQYCGWNLTVYKCKKCGKSKYYKDWINKEFKWDNLK